MKDDTISRAAALDALGERPMVWTDDNDYVLGARNQYDMDRLAIETVPSAQPDHIGEVTEMVGDAVSRQGVLRLLNAVPSEEFATKAMLISGVNALPSAQPGWIPVTERLPEVKQRVLVQQKDGFMMVRKCIDGGHLAWFYSDIVAWQPLPTPYREGGQDG